VDEDHAVGETPCLQQVEVQADVIGQCPLPTADHRRSHEQLHLVDQSGPDRLAGQVGTADEDVPPR